MNVDLAVFLSGFGKGVRARTSDDPTTEESPTTKSKIESPESGDYNLHHSMQKRNVTENREYFLKDTKTRNNLQNVRT